MASETERLFNYAVVEFIGDSANSNIDCAVVPSNWLRIKTGECFWPEVPGVKSTWVQSRKTPESSWPCYPYKRILYQTDDLLKARQKCAAAQDETDVYSTDAEETRKRKMKKRRYLQSSDSDSAPDSPTQADQSANPRMPCIFQRNGNADITASPPAPNFRLLSPSVNESSGGTVPPASTRFRLSSPTPLPENRGIFQRNGNADIATSPAPTRFRLPSPAPLPENRVLEHLLTLFEEVKQKQKEQDTKLNHILAMQQQIIRNCKEHETPASLVPNNTLLPIESEEMLKDFNELINGDQAAKQKMIRYCATIGGESPAEASRRILRRVISTDLAMKYNLTGSKGKRAFKALALYSVIYAAVRERFPLVTEQTFDGVTSKWFTSARDRDGGRKKRQAIVEVAEPEGP